MASEATDWSRLYLHSDNMMYMGIAGLVHQHKQKPTLEAIEAIRAGLKSAKASVGSQENSSIFLKDEKNKTLLVPNPEILETKIASSQNNYEVTIKMFYLSSSTARHDDEGHAAASEKAEERIQDTRDAMKSLSLITGINTADVFIGSIAGVVFDEDEDDEEITEGAEARCKAETKSAVLLFQRLAEMDEFKTLGVAEFTLARLELFLEGLRSNGIEHPIRINQINLKDCCVMPRDLMEYTKARGIELWTSADPPVVLPERELVELLREHGLLAAGREADIVPRWVLKYSAVAKDRSIVENKGYIALIERRV